jgi:hypothetical protein
MPFINRIAGGGVLIHVGSVSMEAPMPTKKTVLTYAMNSLFVAQGFPAKEFVSGKYFTNTA